MAAAYQWAPLRDARCTRLVILLPGERDSPIEIELTEVSLDDDPTYEAVSYTWASANEPQTIYINKKPMTIRKNLQDFLVQLRANLVAQQSKVLWIDALSISQDQLVEKGQQVAMIGDIFNQAERVLVWLGEHADGSELVFRDDLGIHSYNPRHHSSMVAKTKLHYRFLKRSWKARSVNLSGPYCCVPLSEQAQEDRADAWAHLLRRKYWSRLWIVQELVNAKSVVVHCGDRSRNWEALVHLNMTAMHEDPDKPGYFDGIYTALDWDGGILLPDKYRFVTSLRYSVGRLDDFMSDVCRYGRSRNLIQVMQLFCFRSKCQDRRDRVYSLLSISSLPEIFAPDYTIEIPQLFLRIYTLHYSGNSLNWTQDSVLEQKQQSGSGGRRSRLRPDGWRSIHRLFEIMGLSGPEICTVIDMLFTLPISHPPGGSDEYYAAAILVAAQFFMHDAQVIEMTFEETENLWGRSYNEVMPLVRSDARAAAREIVDRLRAELVPTDYLVGRASPPTLASHLESHTRR